MWGSQCSVSGRRPLCHRHRGTERLLVWWSTGAADWFRKYLDTKDRSLPRSHSMLAMIAQLQLPSFNRSSGARKLTDNFYWFSQHAVLRQVHRSEPHDSRSSLVIRSEIGVSSILFRELVLLPFLLMATVTFNFERVFLSSGSRGKEKKEPHVQILQFCSVRRIDQQTETKQVGHLTERSPPAKVEKKL